MSWPEIPLSDLLELSIGGVWGKESGVEDTEVRVWRVTELKPHGRLDPSSAAHRSVPRRHYESRSLRAGDLLLEKSGGGPKTPVGRVGLVTSVPEPAVCANFMQLMRTRTDLVEPRFLHLYLNHFHQAGGTAGMQTASTNIRNIKASEYVQLGVPLPPKAEQLRIVDLLEDHLSRLDAANRRLKNARKRLIALEQSALDVHFGTDPSVGLDTLINDISAGRSFGFTNAPASDDEWGIIKVSAMTWGEFKPDENKAVPTGCIDRRFEIREGDLLVSRANTADYVGASVLVGPVRPKLLLSDKSLRLTPKDNVRAEWLWRALQAPSARRQISGLATGTKDSMRNISQSSLRQILLPKSGNADQDRALAAFANLKEGSDRLRCEVDLMLVRLVGLRQSLLAAAFSGRLTGDAYYPSVREEMITA